MMINTTNALDKVKSAISLRRREAQKDKGAGFVEYAGILLVIGAIAAAVIAASGEDGIGGTIKENIETAVDNAFDFLD
ncbi:hypothetical protein HNR23_000719 [Nocardiopsis mwathae]|uniref:Uncharacterized protein n=1 Tax=Nocardiopsis mwathae TaxID=1472723 RepID=A0A7X0D514_9ACTN|nr:hypothetical protein [Nocardiopsis mwathae]MBB6170659.1 hypothetical protein [Nocardiopsis mwathae]